MPRLMVKYGKTKKATPFHPTLRLRDTGYARSHWQIQLFREGCFGGSSTLAERGVAEQIAHYFSELKRTGHEAVASCAPTNKGA